MPATETTFIIGVIREKEKDLLDTANYQRLIDAKSPETAVQSLTDTVYAPYVGDFSAHLKSLQEILIDLLESEDVIRFISARYDGLNIAAALIEKKLGFADPSPLSSLGSIRLDLLHSVIWNNLGWEALPKHWQSFIAEQLDKPLIDGWQTALILQTGQHTVNWMTQLAKTPLMKSIVRLTSARLDIDKELRFTDTPLEQIAAQSEKLGYRIPLDVLRTVRSRQDGTAYEKFWDLELINLINAVRWDPTGFDPILGFWYTKELEIKSLRLLLAAKANGVAPAKIADLIRPLHHLAV